MSESRITAMSDSRATARAVMLVTACVFINYVDRGNLATAAPLIHDELHLSATQVGVLLSAFYYGYVVCMPGMGWLAERYGARRVLAMGLTLWALATFLTGFAGSFAMSQDEGIDFLVRPSRILRCNTSRVSQHSADAPSPAYRDDRHAR